MRVVFLKKFLDELSDAQRQTVIRLPYRVGLWVSQSDEMGGALSHKEELQTLAGIINGFTEDVFGSEVVQHVMSETMAHKDQWPEWGKKLETVPDECVLAVDALSEVIDEKELNAFKHHLIEIAEAVALAFREYNEEEASLAGKFKLRLQYYKGKMQANLQKRPYRSWDEFLNISMKEREALVLLAKSLGETYV